MLLDSSLPKSLWSEAVRYATFVLNRCETCKNEKGETLALLTYGKNTSFYRFRLFSCVAFVHLKETKDKILERSKKMFLWKYLKA